MISRRGFLQTLCAVPFVWRARARAAQPPQDLSGFMTDKPCDPNAKATPAVAPVAFKPGAPARTALGGATLVLTGSVIGLTCGRIKGARVDFWQADAHGAYDTAGFGHRGYQLTDKDGHYRLETVVPGPPPGHAPHIDVRVEPPGTPAFTTQVFFPDGAKNVKDPNFRSELVMKKMAGSGSAGLVATFDILLNL
jgi:protocatechuate 3,4-dioxygenase beta subunit